MTSREKPSKRIRAEKQGRRAEAVAVFWLRLKGYKILEQRFKTKSGEIDIIASRGHLLAMVEVKYRRTLAQAHESLHPAALRRIQNAADDFVHRQKQFRDFDQRFDAFFVLPGLRVKHLPDAWRTY